MVDSTNLPEIDINAIATDLNNKMDRDGSNVETLSQSFMNMFMPDYSRLEKVSSPYTASANGIILWNNGGSENCTINGYTVYIGGNDNSNEGPVLLPLSKNDVINFKPDYGQPCFIPYKGSV